MVHGFTESYGLSAEHLPGNVKRDAINFGIETPSKRSKAASSVPSTNLSTSLRHSKPDSAKVSLL